jgi:hypothetical protein
LSLVSEIKRRQKTAGLGEAGVRLASEAGEELLERGALQASQDRPADLPAMMIRPMVETHVSNLVSGLVEQGKIRPRQAKKTIEQLMAQAHPAIQEKEREAYRREAGQRTIAPGTLAGTAMAATTATSFPWLLSRGSWLWGKKPKHPMSLGESFKFNFAPAFVPMTAGFEALNHLLAPLSDPMRKRRERGYWKSVGESFKGGMEGLAEGGAEARARYGAFGIPLQMFHGIMNPLASLAYLGQQVGGAFKKPDYASWAHQAAEKRKAMQEASGAE